MFFLFLLVAVGGTSNEHDFASGCRTRTEARCALDQTFVVRYTLKSCSGGGATARWS